MPQDLQQFVRDALLQGATKTQIKKELEAAGWEKDEISQALDEYMESKFSVPVPKRKPYLSAREAFLYLLMFLSLYITAFSLGMLLFSIINISISDVAFTYDYTYDSTRESMRSAISALIIAFPLFAWMSSLINRRQEKNPNARSSKIRKWLTYITLFVAAIIIVSSLITLVYNLLSGEITTRFILKVLTVLGITGGIFGFYLWDLRREEKEK